MSTDQLLRDALHDDAGTEPARPSWDGVRGRAREIQHRRSIGRGVTAVAALLAVVGVATAVLADRTDNERRIVAGPPTGREVVAVVGHNRDGDRLVVMSADDGREVRTLAEGVGVTLGGIAVTPDGSTVYFTRARHGLPCDTTEIARVPVAGGAIETVASPGASPVISPDGTELVWARPVAADPCGAMTYLSRAPLTSAGELVPEINVGFGASTMSTVAPWAWSPDGGHIVAGGRDGEERWPSVATLALPWLEARVDLRLPSQADDATYLPDGRLVVAFLDEETGGHRLVTYGETGEPIETIFETTTSGIWNIDADSSGDLLIHAGGDLLQRWTPGDAAATTIATGVRDAAWVSRR
jgi:hypothetical protein